MIVSTTWLRRSEVEPMRILNRTSDDKPCVVCGKLPEWRVQHLTDHIFYSVCSEHVLPFQEVLDDSNRDKVLARLAEIDQIALRAFRS
jgi:hypothetical protein